MQLSLYLGVPLKDDILSSYSRLSSEKLTQLKEYLEVVECDGESYLGKNLGSEFSIEALVTTEAHVLSLLHRFVPVKHTPPLNVISIDL